MTGNPSMVTDLTVINRVNIGIVYTSYVLYPICLHRTYFANSEVKLPHYCYSALINTHKHTHTHTCRGCEVRTCDFALRTEDPIKTPIKTKLFQIFENKLQKWI